MSARHRGGINNNCILKFDSYTKAYKRCCDGKYHYSLFQMIQKQTFIYNKCPVYTIFVFHFSDTICNGVIKLCENCSDSSESNNNLNDVQHCRTFSSNYYHILKTENKSFVFYNDSDLDCCWRVYSEFGFNGKSRIISGREWKNRKWVETKCTTIDFTVHSLNRINKASSVGP